MAIKLFQFPTFWNIPNPSIFCMKIESYLRMTKLPYEIITTTNLRKAPKGKLPYIDDEGEIIADSSFIITHLKEKYGDSVDQQLTPEQRAHALAIQRLVEDHLYWVLCYSRWIDPLGWQIVKDVFFQKAPSYLRSLIATVVRQDIKKALHKQGIGRHTREQIYQLGKLDLLALSRLLDNHTFFCGEQITSIDATVHACLTSIIQPPIESPLKIEALKYKNLIEYCQRMDDRLY